MSGGTGKATVMFENIVCLLTDFDEYPLISAKLPILMDGCFLIIFQEQSKETIGRRQKQMNERKNKE
jgi:hypothetical protein